MSSMSPIFKIGRGDLIRGLIVTLLSVLFSVPLDQLGRFIPILNDPIVQLAVATVLGYLSKNLITNEKGEIMGVAVY